MTNPETMIVVDREGARGNALRQQLDENARHVLIRLESGQAILVEKSALQKQADGSFYLPMRFADLPQSAADDRDEVVIPVVEEEVHVEKQPVTTGRVRISKRVDERDVLIDQPLTQEHVEVERVAVNRMVDEPPEVRYEGDTMIIPVLEEVVVAEVKLMVREEIHVRRMQQEVHEPQKVTLRREEVSIERAPEDERDDSP